MSAEEYSFIDPLADVGRYFRLAERTDLWFDYAPPSNSANRGTTDRRRSYYEKDSRFQVLQQAHAVNASAIDGKAYEVLLVLPVDDSGQTIFDDLFKIDTDYLERVRLVTDLPQEVTNALLGLKGKSYADLAAFQDAIAALLPDDDRDRIEESLTNATQTGYLWSIYANKPYITLELLASQIEEIIQKYKYPKLYKSDTGINVVTLQIWLKMLGFYAGLTSGLLDEETANAVASFRADQQAKGIFVPTPSNPLVVDWDTWEAMENILKQRLPPDPYTLERLPFPRHSDYDTEDKYQKALYEGLKRFGFPIPASNKHIEFRLTTNANGVGRLTNIPPGEYDLTIESLNTNPTGSTELHLVDANGEPIVGTVALSGPGGQFDVMTQIDGLAVLDGVKPGDYSLSIQNAQADVVESPAGSVEIHLVDSIGMPVSAHVVLSGDLGEQESLQKAVKLFKALARSIDLYEDRNGHDRFIHILSDKLEETAINIDAWEGFTITWGAFYGAPWLGVILDCEDISASQECNWGTYTTLTTLYEWGHQYIITSPDEAELVIRLNRPIALRHISNSIGGNIRNRADFSQTGSQVSLHVPRKDPRIESGNDTGKLYGGIPYDSEKFDRAFLITALDMLDEIGMDGETLCPDKAVTDRYESDRELIVIHDLFPKHYFTNTKLRINHQSWGLGPSMSSNRPHRGNFVKFYNDASENWNGTIGAFSDIEKAIDSAEHFIFIAAWSFHPHMSLSPSGNLNEGGATSIGKKLKSWAEGHPKGLVAIHTWNHTYPAPDAQNDDGKKIFDDEILIPGNLWWRMSSRTGKDGKAGYGWAHHQKFIVMDCQIENSKKRGICAFIGGLDLTQGRFDWSAHPIISENVNTKHLRKVMDKKWKLQAHEWYNSEFNPPKLTTDEEWVDTQGLHPRQAWHDAHCQMSGPAAWDILKEFAGRWLTDPATSIVFSAGDTHPFINFLFADFYLGIVDPHYRGLFAHREGLFVTQKEAEDKRGNWIVQTNRSLTRDHFFEPDPNDDLRNYFRWTLKHSQYDELAAVRERSIQESYLTAIKDANKFIYIETQYFIGSGANWAEERASVANTIPRAILKRILEKAGQPFHVYLILPMYPEGEPKSNFSQIIRNFQWRSIEVIIEGMAKAWGRERMLKEWHKYITIGYLANWEYLDGPITGGTRKAQVVANKRHMIYVHSKMMIVDDQYLIIGSANLNERSLAGDRDSEICISMWPDDGKSETCRKQVREFRYKLWKEHFGLKEQDGKGLSTTELVVDWSKPHEWDKSAKVIQTIGDTNRKLLEFGKIDIESKGMKKSGHFCNWPIDPSLPYLGLIGPILDGPQENNYDIWPHSEPSFLLSVVGVELCE